jgi:hypothetical protein
MRFKKRLSRLFVFVAMALLAVSACAREPDRIFIIGQDLDSVRDYFDSECCANPDGSTTYLSFYNLLSAEAGYGGLGIDAKGNPVDEEYEWGAGPINAWKSAHEFGDIALAIGLNLTENEHPGALDRLVAGDYDENIRQLARFLLALDNTVYLRIGYEFDGFWNRGYEDRQRYIEAWRRIVGALREAGVENTEFVWQAAVFPLDEMTDGGHDNLRDWYPGDDFVNWMAFSSFLGLDERPEIEVEERPPTARELTDELLAFARERGKPVMIAEASPQGYDLARGLNANHTPGWDGPQGEGRRTVSPEQIWEEWYAPLLDYMDQNSDVIRALAYINCHWDVQAMWGAPYESGYWGDTRLQASPEIAHRFSAAIDAWRANP